MSATRCIAVISIAILGLVSLPSTSAQASTSPVFSAPAVASEGPLNFTTVINSVEREDDSHTTRLYWGTRDAKRIFIDFDGPTEGIDGLVGKTARLDGNVVNGRFHVSIDRVTVVETVHAAAAPVPAGDKTMLVIPVNLSDSPVSPLSRTQLDDLYFGATGSVSASYKLQSTNQLRLSGYVMPFVNVAYSEAEGCKDDQWADAADAAATAAGINLASYNYVSYLYNLGDNPCGGFSGVGQVPGKYTWMYGINAYLKSTVAHEWGHNLGLGHANWLKCTDGSTNVSYSATCTSSAYADTMSVMGYGQYNVLPLNNAVHLSRLGWLPADRIQTVSSSTTLTLNKLYSHSGTTVVKIARPNGAYLWVEYRTPSSPFDTQGSGGVMFHNDLAGNQTQVLGLNAEMAGFQAESSFYDFRSDTTVRVTNTTADTATLSIEVAGAPPTNPPPTTTTPPTTAPPVTSPPTSPAATTGYRLLSADGTVSGHGASAWYGDARGRIAGNAVSLSPTKTNNGYWIATDRGEVLAFGDALSYGSMAGQRLNKPVINMAATPSGRGYWLLARDGGVFSFGDAAFFGSTGNMTLNQPAVGMTPTATGNGYWFVAEDGGIFAFGDAPFFGSMGSVRLNQPVAGMTTSSTGLGYRMVARDGGIFSFGDAAFFGSLGSNPPASPVRAMRPTLGSAGYYLVTESGAVYSYGDARYFGGSSGRTVVAMSF